MKSTDSPRSIANFLPRDETQPQSSPPPPLHRSRPRSRHRPPPHRVRFDNKVRVLLVPSTKDFSRQEIESTWITPQDTEDNEDDVIETMLLMRRRMETTPTSSSSLLSFDDTHEENIEMTHQTTFRGLEHLLQPMGAMRQKRGRQLLIASIVERQRTDASGKRVINADELAMISQLLSRDATDRARAKGIEYERVEKKCNCGIRRSTHGQLIDTHNPGENEEEEKVPRTPPRTYHMCASSTSSPNLMRSISRDKAHAWRSLDSERSMRSLRSYGRRQGTSASSA